MEELCRKCTNCQSEEVETFTGNPNCPYARVPREAESIEQIKINLGRS